MLESREDALLPFTDDLPDTFQKAYGEDLMASLPELFWELPKGRVSRIRYLYHDHIAERFSSAFADTIGSWCEKHGLALTGHMMEEPTLHSQTAALGEAMRSYRSFQIPGIDMLHAAGGNIPPPSRPSPPYTSSEGKAWSLSFMA